ncbi:PREDICTED: zinc finger protein RFP-like [Crocodylus porosus]|uniref:Zinc finger protein RFP-like n=1 Tax=Crocodylus porosus TaxID=8502 RepID=A0A7M4ED47_CROPO|nr:PREDICTED: zinc finger protein RFP-like [Crocodylus porosus]
MAAESSVQSLREEATCSICLDFFRDPVMVVGCGHNFCQACITQCWEGAETDVTCPQCRQTFPQGTLGPNRQVCNLVELVKGLSVRPAEAAGGQQVCGEHGEALKLFCQDDEAPICVVCDRSRAHRFHSVVPLEEAAEEYKEKLQAHLRTLRGRRETLLGFKQTGEGKTQEYLKQTAAERQKIMSEFRQLRWILLEQEQLLLAQLGELEKEAEKIQEAKVIKLSEEISHLSELISEMEAKCQQPASEFLQGIRKTLSRCERGEIPQLVPISPELERRLQDFCQTTCAMTETGREFKDTFPSALEKRSGDVPHGDALQPYTKATVTLDPDTAHPSLVFSADRRRVQRAETRQHLPENPKRFGSEPCVLGCEGFISGRHCWEVEVGQGYGWAVGVARESVKRKGLISFSPEGGIWAVQRCGGQFQALTAPAPTRLDLRQAPSKLRVCLDYAGGQVAFLDADTKAPIFTFPPTSFAGDIIRPWLWLELRFGFSVKQMGFCPVQLRLCP